MMNERIKLYQREFTPEDTNIINYINKYHSLQKINIIQFEPTEIHTQLLKNNQTIKIQTSLYQLFTNEFIDYLSTNKTVEFISQTTQNNSIILHYYNSILNIILEQQEYQILGINGEYNKMTERYYVKLPIQSIKQNIQLKDRL